ncbi:MAG: 23S rRNA (uracil(1939)-C(5))-methyltransferase RlmD [Clostridiales bacterium]|nr:23S rRNA (uracil(1939)-C(5))-methyltransferase RlmD [Clostridiales bacterium]
MPELRKGATLRVDVIDMNNLGAGIAKVDGAVVFVRGGVTGDVADVEIIKATSSYFVARIVRLVRASEHRTASECPVSNRCGGCVFRNITYEYETEIKRSIVEGAMRRAGLDIGVLPVLTAGRDSRYRNKALYPIGRLRISSNNKKSQKDRRFRSDAYIPAIGFFADHSHELIPLPGECDCLLAPESFGEICEFTRLYITENRVPPYDETTGKGIARHLYLRSSETTGEVMVTLVLTCEAAWITDFAERLMSEFPFVSGVFLNLNPEKTNVVLGRDFRLIRGKGVLTDELRGRKFEYSPGSFWQVNRGAAELLLNRAAEMADIHEGDRVLDLFCGIGTVGMAVSPADAELFGIEIVESAVMNARRNAELNGFTRAAFACCDADDPDAVRKALEPFRGSLDVVLTDPPRGGCDQSLIDIIAGLDAKRIVYISCNPNTLARDLVIFREKGLAAEWVQPVDLFPRTGHVECVCLLSK